MWQKKENKNRRALAEAVREFPPSDVPELRLRSRRAPGAVRPWAFALPPASGFRKSEEGGFSFRASRRGGPFRRPRSAAVFPLTSPQRRHFSFERPGVRRFSLDAPECGSFPLRTCRRRHFSFERPGVRYFFFRRPGMREFPPSDVPERGDSLPDEPQQPWDGLPFRGKLRNNSPPGPHGALRLAGMPHVRKGWENVFSGFAADLRKGAPLPFLSI